MAVCLSPVQKSVKCATTPKVRWDTQGVEEERDWAMKGGKREEAVERLLRVRCMRRWRWEGASALMRMSLCDGTSH